MAPTPFIARFTGPEGHYALEFEPSATQHGTIKTEIGGKQMTWHVDFVDVDQNGGTTLGGLTKGTEGVWGDCYWFNIQAGADAPYIEYWGNQVLWRTDWAMA
jgi:hypothetical protein